MRWYALTCAQRKKTRAKIASDRGDRKQQLVSLPQTANCTFFSTLEPLVLVLSGAGGVRKWKKRVLGWEQKSLCLFGSNCFDRMFTIALSVYDIIMHWNDRFNFDGHGYAFLYACGWWCGCSANIQILHSALIETYHCFLAFSCIKSVIFLT